MVLLYLFISDFEIYLDQSGMARRLKSVKDTDQK